VSLPQSRCVLRFRCAFYLFQFSTCNRPFATASLSGAFGGERRIVGVYLVRQTDLALSGLLASAILKMDGIGGLDGWRWIFILGIGTIPEQTLQSSLFLEGIATCLIGLMSAFILPASLDSARFFSQEEMAFASV
jgi:hypothetical protein